VKTLIADAIAENLDLKTERQLVRQAFDRDPTWRAYRLIAEWPVDDGPAGDWARMCKGMWLEMLSHRIERRLRALVEEVSV
jgi:hypothetical protein